MKNPRNVILSVVILNLLFTGCGKDHSTYWVKVKVHEMILLSRKRISQARPHRMRSTTAE